MSKTKKYGHLFNTDHLQKDLKVKSVKGGINTMTAEGVSMAMRIGSTIILARLLTPNDYGLIGMVTAVTGFAHVFKDLGLSQATIQTPELSHVQVSNLFWINVAFGVTLTLLTSAISPVIAWFYDEPRLIWITLLLSTSFLFGGLTLQHQALLRRQMRFGQLALIRIIAVALSIPVGVGLACRGFEYWALVWMQISATVFGAAGVWFFCRWLPAFPSRGSGVSSLVRFGIDVTGFNALNYFSRNFDKVLLGRFYGAGPLGLYSKAYQLLMFPINQVRNPLISVGMPALSALQNNSKAYKRYYIKLVSMISLVSMPLVTILMICSDNLIIVLLGENWRAASDIFRILALVAFIQPSIAAGRGLAMLSMGFSRRYLHFGIFSGIVTVLGFLAGIKWGAIGVASGYVFAYYLLIIFTLPWCLKGIHVDSYDFISAIRRPVVASVIMAIAMFFTKSYIYLRIDGDSMNIKANLFVIFFSALAGILVFLTTICILPGGFKTITSFCKDILSAFNKKVSKKPAEI